VNELVRYVFSLGGLIFATAVGVVWLRARPSSTAPRRYLAAVVFFYLLASTYAVDFLAGRLLTVAFQPFNTADIPPRPIALVVLGSNSFTARNWADEEFSIVDQQAAMRVVEAARVYRMTSPEWVISSGGVVTEREGPGSAGGITMRDDLIRLGIPAERIHVEAQSSDTHDEARIVGSMLASLGAKHVILVTSELHMWRSVHVFRAAGIEVVPAKARGVFTHLPWYRWIIPTNEGLAEAAMLAHELIGIPYYWARGWFQPVERGPA